MIITYEDDQKTRLDKFLMEKYPEISRTQIQKTIKRGDVLVDEKKATVHHFLKTGEKINIKTDLKELKVVNQILELQPNTKIKLDIISETDDYLVINKQSGLLVHPTHKNETDTLANVLLHLYPEIISVGDTQDDQINVRPGIVHRLDREVSGVMIIAKNQKMFEHLKKQFQDRVIEKEYITLVHGEMEEPSGTIDFPLGMNKETGKMAARPKNTDIESKSAITKYEVLEQFQHYALLKVNLLTGRTHQIRVHLNAIGHPIVNDSLYKPRKLKSRISLNRTFLHAKLLGFYDLQSNWQEVECPLPEKLENFLNNLKNKNE